MSNEITELKDLYNYIVSPPLALNKKWIGCGILFGATYASIKAFFTDKQDKPVKNIKNILISSIVCGGLSIVLHPKMLIFEITLGITIGSIVTVFGIPLYIFGLIFSPRNG